MEQDKQTQKPDPDSRRVHILGSQVKIDFPDGSFEKVRSIVSDLTERGVSVFPSGHDEFGEFILEVGRDRYYGLQEIRDNFELICSSAIEVVPVREPLN